MGQPLKKIEKALSKAVMSNRTYEEVTNIVSRLESSASYSKGCLVRLPGLFIFVGDKKLFYFEKAETWGSLTRLQKKLNLKYCPPPFYTVGEGYFTEKFYAAKNDNEFADLIYSIFQPLTMATIFNQMICSSNILSKHKSTIFETMEAYWLGMDYISTDSLIVVFEASLRDLIGEISGDRPSLKFKSHIRSLAIKRLDNIFQVLKEIHWYPYKNSSFEYALENSGTDEELKFWVLLDHTMDAINAFLIWFNEVLYKEYMVGDGDFSLNRHNILHGFSGRQAVPVYYPLIFWSLLSVYYIESLFLRPKTCFFPEADDKDKELSNYFYALVKEDGPAEGRRRMAKKFGVSYGGA